jgi:sec-independent protein translocase protein TatA
MPQGFELVAILLVVLLLFGGAKLPKLARSLGQAKSEFEKGTKGEGDDTPPTGGTSGGAATPPTEV